MAPVGPSGPERTQSTQVKVVGTFHVPFTQNAVKPLDLRGTWERSSEFCRLCLDSVIPDGRSIASRWQSYPQFSSFHSRIETGYRRGSQLFGRGRNLVNGPVDFFRECFAIRGLQRHLDVQLIHRTQFGDMNPNTPLTVQAFHPFDR